MIFTDFETRSHAPLGLLGGRGYARDPSSELLTATALDTRTEPAVLYAWSPLLTPEVRIRNWEVGAADLAAIGFPADAVVFESPTNDLPEPIAQAARDGVPFAAHNADGFDEHVWTGLEYPHIGHWVDTLPLLARRGLPRALDLAGRAVFNVGKDPLGYRLMMASSIPQKKGVLKGRHIPPDSARLSRITHYCARDALLMAALWYEERLGEPNVDDDVMWIHSVINHRGVAVDIEAARRLRAEDQRQQEEAIQRAFKATEGAVTEAVLASPIRLRNWLKKECGLALPDVARQTVEARLAEGCSPTVTAVLEGRLATSRITSGKIDALLHRTCPDHRLRDMYVYYGAHTGRFSARGVQTQNLASQKVKVTEDIYDSPEHAPAVAIEEEVTVADVLGSMLRGLFTSPPEKAGLGIVDYSAIEARVLLWCAEDWDALETYIRGEDAYKKLAARIFSVPYDQVTKLQRQAGKVGILAAGYQGGPAALSKMAEKSKIDFAAAGITPEQVVEAWRDAHLLIAGRATGTWTTPEGKCIITRKGGLWRDSREVVTDIVRGFVKNGDACRCHWFRGEGQDAPHLFCRLPSGRLLIYRTVEYEKVRNKFGGESWSVTYLSARGQRIATYGGKLVENVVQAICRDLLTTAMLELEANGLPVVMHVHDELVFECEVAADYTRGVVIIEKVPVWAPRMPIKVDGTLSKRYCKP